MSIVEWFPLLNASVLEQNQLSQNSILFVMYLIVAVIIKRSSYLMAFFMSCMLFELAIFDVLSEMELYAITFCIYSYVMFDMTCKRVVTVCCGIIVILSVVLGYDAYFYGIGGIYGTHEAIIYNNIESLALSAHILLIASLIDYRRVWNYLCSFADYVVYISRSTYNALYVAKIIKEASKSKWVKK